MVQKSKYDRRTAEVQTLMGKPPHSLIIWGNVLVLGVITCFFVIAHFIHISRTVTVGCRLTQVKTSNDGKAIFDLDSLAPSNIEKGHFVFIFANGDLGTKKEFPGSIDSIYRGGRSSRVEVKFPGASLVNSRFAPPTGSVGDIQFELKPISFLELLIKKTH
jgi:hypothetical protein